MQRFRISVGLASILAGIAAAILYCFPFTLYSPLLPAMLAWLVPSAYNSWRYGFFDSSVFGGYALGGHVAWAIHPQPGSRYSTEARLIEQRIAPVLAKRPAKFKSLTEYIDYTAIEYNTLLWANMVPELQSYYSSQLPAAPAAPCTGKACRPDISTVINATLLRLSKEAIAAQSFCYCGLCLNAYFLGTALAQPSLVRYAWVMQGLAAALLSLGAYLVCRGAARWFSYRWSRASIENKQSEGT